MPPPPNCYNDDCFICLKITYSIIFNSQGADAISTGRILVGVIKICFDQKKWDALNENIVLVTKRRGQLKQVSYEIIAV